VPYLSKADRAADVSGRGATRKEVRELQLRHSEGKLLRAVKLEQVRRGLLLNQ
jgi:hypothetical protein